jgi:NTE family protein
MLDHVRNLVFEGGGVKGIAYIGAMEELDHVGVLKQIVRVGGTSAGAINATILALDYSLEEQNDLLKSLDFNEFMDDDWGVVRDTNRLLDRFGWHKGDFFHNWIGSLVKTKLGSKDATFLDLVSRGTRKLYVYGTNLSTGFSEVFSHEKTPNTSIADAVRISMSIPLFFAAVRNSRGDVYCDGGVLNNYPIKLFDREEYIQKDDRLACARTTDYYDRINAEFLKQHPKSKPYVYNRQTLGFRLDTKGEISLFRDRTAPEARQIADLFDFTKALISALISLQENYHLHEDDWHRTIYIDTLDVKTTDFALPREKKEALIMSGREGTKSYLDWYGKSEACNKPSAK